MRPISALAAIVVGIFALAAPGPAAAYHSAGIRIAIGKFTLYVHYDDVANRQGPAEAVIQDPDRALFTLVGLIQANAERFAAIEDDLLLEILDDYGSPGAELSVCDNCFLARSRPWKVEARDLGKAPVAADLVVQMVTAVCARHAAACKAPPAGRLTLYPAKSDLGDGSIAFGVFGAPSLVTRYSLRPQAAATAKAIRVKRGGMKALFGTIPGD